MQNYLRVQKVMHNNVMSPRSMNVVFTRIGFAIQKGLPGTGAACCPLAFYSSVNNGLYIYIYIYIYNFFCIVLKKS